MDIVNPALDDYLAAHATPADDILRDLAEETQQKVPGTSMPIGPNQGALLNLLVKMVRADLAVELGVFTGYSSICIARGLSPGGRLVACDVSEEWTGIAQNYWQRAGLTDRIELRLAPAEETLRSLPAEHGIDFAFVDADKTGYPVYYEELVPRMRPGGLIVLDNVLRNGRVVDPEAQDAGDIAIRQVNDTITADSRVESMMLPIQDGVTLVRKR